MNVHFEILKLKKHFQLEIPFNSTFSYVSELVFNHFGLNKNDYPSDKNSLLKFIFKQIYCRYERTIESYNINSQSNIYISVPNFLLPLFSKEEVIEVTRTIEKPKDTSQLIISHLGISLPQFNEDIAYSNILRSLHPTLLQQLTDCGYDQKSAAYALIYHQDMDNAIELLSLKIPDDPEFRKYINLIYYKRVQYSELVQYDLMLSCVIAKYTKENAYVRAAVCIHFYLLPGKNIPIKNKLIAFYNQVDKKYPGQIQKMINTYFVEKMRPMIFYPINFL